MISEILETDLYLTKDRIRVELSDIKLVRSNDTTHQNQCYQRELKHFLKKALINSAIKVKWSQQYRATDIYRQAEIKIQDNKDLGLILLRQGWAQLEPDSEKTNKFYLNAQISAQAQRLGRWGSCDNWYELRERQRLKGKTSYLKPNAKTYLDSVSYGWVTKIIEPHIYELENGQRLELQGVKAPDKKSAVYACWQKALLPELESLLLGKKVRLEADNIHLSARGQRLKRYVWLEGNRWQSPILINTWLLNKNYAQLNKDELILKYVETMNEAALNEAPPLWWAQCAGTLVSNVQEEEVAALVAPLEYDESCPIKGNISGSKKNPKKTYHTPLSGWYKRIEAEQCFVDEAEAEAAGFVKVK